MFTAYTNFWKQYVDFKGRAKPSEFWWPFLFNNLVRLGFYLIFIIDLVLPFSRRVAEMQESALSTEGISIWTDISPVVVVTLILWLIFELAILVPSLAIGVRRLRDAAFHWTFIFLYGAALLISLIPLGWVLAIPLTIASIVLWAFPSREKKPKANSFYNQAAVQFVTTPQAAQALTNGQQVPVQPQQFNASQPGQTVPQGQPFQNPFGQPAPQAPVMPQNPNIPQGDGFAPAQQINPQMPQQPQTQAPQVQDESSQQNSNNFTNTPQ
ncbi:DUF805 domain-containing protein [Streptococcus dentasini]